MADEYGLYVKTATGTAEVLKPGIDRRVTALETSQAAQDKKFLPLAGGTMTGMLTLKGAPTANLHAATKTYVDTTVSTAIAGGVFPSGTQMLFHQAAAPTGWTKVTSVNDATLRVVSGTTGGGTGGSIAFSTLFAAGKAVTLSGNVAATTLAAATTPSISLSSWRALKILSSATGYGWEAFNYNSYSERIKYAREWATMGATGGSGGSHTHALAGTATISLAVKYTDVIICTKA